MDEPKQKFNAAIRRVDKGGKFIDLYCDKEFMEALKPYGDITTYLNQYTLWVDGRFDFDEVLEYIKEKIVKLEA